MISRAYVDSLAKPLYVRLIGKSEWWAVDSVDIGAGTFRIAVASVKVADVAEVKDGNGVSIEPSAFSEKPAIDWFKINKSF